MSVEAFLCPQCGGKVSPDEEICRYCGTFYTVKGKQVLSMLDLPATDENLEKYVRLVNLRDDHLVERGVKVRVVSKEVVRQNTFTARNDLKEELLREPTIREVEQRTGVYISAVEQQKTETQAVKMMSTWLILVIVLFVFSALFMLLLFMLFVRNMFSSWPFPSP